METLVESYNGEDIALTMITEITNMMIIILLTIRDKDDLRKSFWW